MRKLLLSTLALQLLLSAALSKAAEPALTKVQIARLESLCRVWGVVKFFHPWIVAPPDGKSIDWDAALIETIPLVEKASTTEEFRAAIDHLLSALHDPATRPIPLAKRQNVRPSSLEPALPETRLIESGGKKILVISATDWRRLAAQESKSPGNLFAKAFVEAADVDAIVLDLRLKSADSGVALQAYIATLLKADLPLPAPRSRFHRGYEPDDIPNNPYGSSSSPYHSGFLTREHTFLRAKPGPSAGKRLIVLTSAATQAEFGVFAALQSSGQAIIIHDSADFSNFAENEVVYRMQVSENIWATIRTADYINGDGTVDLWPGVVLEPANGEGDDPAMRAGLAIASGENPPLNRPASHRIASPVRSVANSYPEMVSPTREYRLLGLFRVWNVIQFFFAYKQLMDRSWDSILTEFIPRFAAADSADDYGLLAHELVSHLQDSHVGAMGGLAASARDRRLGYPLPTIRLRPIRGEMVVVSTDASVQDRVHVGDVVVTVDGESIATRKKKFTKYIASSTPHALDLALCFSVLLGPADSPATLKLRGPDGVSRDVSLPRSSGQDDAAAWRGIYQFPELVQKTPVFSVLPEGYGYLDGVRLTPEQVSPAFDVIKATPALIIDLRGHAFPIIVSWFGDKPTAGSAGHCPYWIAPVPWWASQGDFGGTWLTDQQVFNNYSNEKYAGHVVVLINSNTRSASEHCCLHLEQAAKGRITFIGSPTAGANGNITFTSMPGGIVVRFSGVDIRHADGRQLQRVGIQPDIRVEPTIAGIAAGKDEVLEAAVRFLNEKKPG